MASAGTLYTTTVTNPTSFSSGPIDVTGISEIVTLAHITDATITENATMNMFVNRVDTFGNVSYMNQCFYLYGGQIPPLPVDFPMTFLNGLGATIQFDLVFPDDVSTASFEFSVTGR